MTNVSIKQNNIQVKIQIPPGILSQNHFHFLQLQMFLQQLFLEANLLSEMIFEKNKNKENYRLTNK